MTVLGIRYQIMGRAEVQDIMVGMKTSIRNRVLRGAITKGVRVVAKEAKALAPEGPTGLTKKSIGTKVVVGRRVVGLVGARTGFRTVIDGVPHDPTKTLHLAEGGRKAVEAKAGQRLAFVGKGGRLVRPQKVRASAGSRFLSAAYHRTKDEVTELVRQDVEDRVLRLRQ